MRVLIAGGGTGGHLFPAFAVARSVRQLQAAAEISWLGGARGVESRLVPEAGYPLTLLAAPSLRRSGAGLVATARDTVKLLWSIPQAIRLIRRIRPDVIFSTGGYIAIPTLIAAWLTRHVSRAVSQRTINSSWCSVAHNECADLRRRLMARSQHC
ncbi:hypothetical protein EBU60_01425 [bacterium]|nr:hypothetical protein [bacterium]